MQFNSFNCLKFRRDRERESWASTESNSVKIDNTSRFPRPIQIQLPTCHFNFEQYYSPIKPLYYQLFYLRIKIFN